MVRFTSLSFIAVALLFCNSIVATTSTPDADAVKVSVDFTAPIFTSITTPTYQVVVNPLVSRSSPIHKAVFDNIAALSADYARMAFWFPYPHYSVAELERPSGLNQCSNVGEGGVVHLSCQGAGSGNGVISTIDFVSYGDFTGTCGNYTMGKCNADNVTQTVQKLCLNKTNCSVPANIFGDPCYGTVKRLAVQVTCNPPMNNTYWNFTLVDQVMEDFLNATGGKPNIMSLSTQPVWLYDLNGTNYHYPDDPNERDWGAAQGSQLLDKSCQEFGEYYGRLAAWYTNGGFNDEYGAFHGSSYKYKLKYWEILNEMEHNTDIKTYTCIYDQVVEQIRLMADPQHEIKFVGLAYSNVDLDGISYFLNRSNHISPDIPLDFISYHHYASSSSRTDPNSYENFFTDYDNWFETVLEVEKIRKALSPDTRTTINELGIILPDDNSPDEQDFPLIYWNAAAASWAYLFSRLTSIGIDVVGMSQMVGYPELPDVLGGLLPQYPSVAMLNWTDGSGTARYWTLKMMIDDFQGGNVLVNTTSSNPDQVYAQAFIEGASNAPEAGKARRLLLVNKKNSPVNVTYLGLALSVVKVVDLSTGFGPPRSYIAKTDTVSLSEFAVAMCRIYVPVDEQENLDSGNELGGENVSEQVRTPFLEVLDI